MTMAGLKTTHQHGLVFLSYYLLFGLLHELSHVVIAAILQQHALSSSSTLLWYQAASVSDIITFLVRASFGRYCLIDIVEDFDVASPAPLHISIFIRHFGWIFSLCLAAWVHYNYKHERGKNNKDTSSILQRPMFVLAAYATALDGISTDLLGLIPAMITQSTLAAASTTIPFFCGNFGIILINSAWINTDGGKKALDILEKMVEVTMMRGAQSGGVVTYEPTNTGQAFYKSQVPIMRGKRSRVVNSKRTTLSQGVRSKIEKDNCSSLGKNLIGWNSNEFNDPIGTGKRLVRGFFGHTRFATSSIASMDGTHPHQWSPRKNYSFFPFQSAAASNLTCSFKEIKPQVLGVENYIQHNGDFEFYKINGKYYDTGSIQQFLIKTLHVAMPCSVDSAAIAGMIDLLRVQGSFALSARYAICFEMCSGSKNLDPMDPKLEYPQISHYVEIGKVFEESLLSLIRKGDITSLEGVSASIDVRKQLECKVISELSRLHSIKGSHSAMNCLAKSFVSFDIEEGDLSKFVKSTVNAFFDNDLLHSTRIFFENAKGSFGLCVTTSMDSYRQAVFAAKGQTLSIAFYPRKGVICFGSEQAAVKAGLNYDLPQGKTIDSFPYKTLDENAVRLDLDDLGGEVCLLDWGYGGDDEPAISPPNRSLPVDKLLGGAVNVVLLHLENVISRSSRLKNRLIHIERNEFVKPLLNDCPDPVLADIHDIPRICANIQEDWQDVGLNRMTAWHLGQCVQKRLQGRLNGTIESHANQVDILLTGCEVSLWLAEQFAADLTKCFPKLGVKAVSSNKLLGLFGQGLSMPSIGFPFTSKCMNFKDAIIIIISHSGGTFAPLACSNLMQSFSPHIFGVTSEWDTQVGKQLRGMYGDKNDLLTSRIFSTEVGVRPAEPCSVSVVATHQLLTNIFQHICMTIIGNPQFRGVTGAAATEQDLLTLERCNRDGITALERIVGVDRYGIAVHKSLNETEDELRGAGNRWSEHILEVVKAYIMSFVYVVATVTSGYPLISGVAKASGLTGAEWFFFIIRFIDSLIYFLLPQINITILRLLQGRNLRHRMVGRCVVIGDPCPWVAQSAEAFLSKIFACSYSIAGLNVLSGNPADHLVHRHTHRVVRGSLLICGRPDGRLTALTSLEASTCLAVNQASSIQSLGGTCESITIGHNASELPLSYKGICLETHRPKFLCERMLDDIDVKDQNVSTSTNIARSSSTLLGVYSNMKNEAKAKTRTAGMTEMQHVIKVMIDERKSDDQVITIFKALDTDGDGSLGFYEFVKAYQEINPNVTMVQLNAMFQEADLDGNGTLDLHEFIQLAKIAPLDLLGKQSLFDRDTRGLMQLVPSKEEYFGEMLEKSYTKGVGRMTMSQSQHLAMELYESRIASMQRFVAMTVMFHQMGMRVQTFFEKISFGLLGYRMDRTHSIMRIATTASPVSGADVRERMLELHHRYKIQKAIDMITRALHKWKQIKDQTKIDAASHSNR